MKLNLKKLTTTFVVSAFFLMPGISNAFSIHLPETILILKDKSTKAPLVKKQVYGYLNYAHLGSPLKCSRLIFDPFCSQNKQIKDAQGKTNFYTNESGTVVLPENKLKRIHYPSWSPTLRLYIQDVSCSKKYPNDKNCTLEFSWHQVKKQMQSIDGKNVWILEVPVNHN